MTALSEARRQRIRNIIDQHRSFKFRCSPDDLEAITAVTLEYRHLVVQLQRLASPLLSESTASLLNSLGVEVDDLYSAFEAHSEVEALVLDIEEALVPGASSNDSLFSGTIIPQGLAAISDKAVNEQISKAKERVATGDFTGAISSSYTLTECLLKFILQEAGVTFNENEGNIRALYKLVREPLNLNPGVEDISASPKPILDGFQKLVTGLYEVSNKAGDRHARRYNPAAHHAKLAVNTAFALCEFLAESREYQARTRNTIPGSAEVLEART